jgi:hypothetical protein
VSSAAKKANDAKTVANDTAAKANKAADDASAAAKEKGKADAANAKKADYDAADKQYESDVADKYTQREDGAYEKHVATDEEKAAADTKRKAAQADADKKESESVNKSNSDADNESNKAKASASENHTASEKAAEDEEKRELGGTSDKDIDTVRKERVDKAVETGTLHGKVTGAVVGGVGSVAGYHSYRLIKKKKADEKAGAGK